MAGIDDILLASFCEPTLTTVYQPKYEAGRHAVQRLLERIQGDYAGGPREFELELRLVIRNSTCPAP